MQFEEATEGEGSRVVLLRYGLPAAWGGGNQPSTVIAVVLQHALIFPAIRGWDELQLSKRCILYQDIETWDLLLDLFTEGIDRRIARKVEEKEFNVVKLGRFFYFYWNGSVTVSTIG